MADEPQPSQRGLSIPLPFEDAIRAALKVKPPQDEKRPTSAKTPRKARSTSGSVPRTPGQPGTAH
jgi:hypothetical protein